MPAADYCDFSGMRIADCEHCRRGGKILPREDPGPQDDDASSFPRGSSSAMPGSPFHAKFASGRCAGCWNAIVPSELIKADGNGGWIHVDCDE